MTNVSYLPIWKAKASAEERFLELAAIAQKHPERFMKVAVVYQERLPSKEHLTRLRQISSGCNTDELIGILEQAKMEVYREAHDLD